MSPALFRARRLLAPALAMLAGAMAVLAFAPFSWYPLAIIAVAVFYQLLQGRSAAGAFGIGWAFGIGLMGFGVFWIRISMNEFGNMAPAVGSTLAALFIVLMALYYGIAGWAINRLARGAQWTGPLLVLPGVWILLEWLRGWLFTGFPWLALGYSQVDAPLAGFAPVAGVYGVSLVVALSAGLLWILIWATRPWPRYLAAGGMVGLLIAGVGLDAIEWTEPRGEPLEAAVLQGNIPQAVKWEESARIPTLETYLLLTRDHADKDVLVWPETALPDFLHRLREPIIEPLSARLRETGADLVFGVPIRDEIDGAPYNAVMSIGAAEDVYYKRHLVPFGEFLPFRQWLGPIAEWFAVPMSDFGRGRAARPLIQVGGLPVGVSICYEDAFPIELSQALPEAAYLINVSNDGWFGDSLAPHQHLQIARMRALENARPLLRATNTGISAIIDHRGELIGIVPAFERGAFVAEIQPRTGATPFMQVGNRLAIGLAAGLVLLSLILSRRGSPSAR